MSYLLFYLKRSILFGFLLNFSVAGNVVFLITLPPRRNKPLIIQNQGLWLVINDCFKEVFFHLCLSVCLSLSIYLWWKRGSVKAKLQLGCVSCTTPKPPWTFNVTSALPNPPNAVWNRQLSLSYTVHHSNTYTFSQTHILKRLERVIFTILRQAGAKQIDSVCAEVEGDISELQAPSTNFNENSGYYVMIKCFSQTPLENKVGAIKWCQRNQRKRLGSY